MNIFNRKFKDTSKLTLTETEQYWQDLLSKSTEWMKKNSFMGQFPTYSNLWDARHAQDGVPRFNLSYIVGSTMISSLVFQRPSIVNTPKRPEFQPWAQFYDGIDNWVIAETEYKEVLEEAVLYAFQQNVVGIELNYDFANSLDEYMTFKPIEGVADRTRKTNQPWFDLIPMEQLRIAEGAKSMRNCWWYAKRVKAPIETLKGLKGINKQNISITEKPRDTQAGSVSDDRDYMHFWIVREAENKTWGWVSTDGKLLKKFEDDPMQFDGLPMELLTFNKSTKSIWGTPDIEYIKTQHLEGDESRYDGRLQSRAANVKCFYDNNLLDEDDVVKFLTDKSMGMIPVDVPGDKKLGDVILMVQPHVQAERFGYQKQLLEDAQYLTGVGYNQMGTFSPGRRTKFEAQIVEERSFLRGSQRRTKISEITEKLFGKVNQIISKEWTANTVQKVVGMEGAIYWVKAKPSEFDEISAQLVTSVNAESLAPTSKERRKQEMLEVMSVLSKFSSSMPGLNLMPVVKSFLSQFDWADVTNLLPQANQNPMGIQEFGQAQQQMAQNPQLAQMTQNNLMNMMPAMGKLPAQTQGGDQE